jgi:hypothetical protein
VVAVVVAEDDLGDVGQLDTQLESILQHGLGPRAGIEQQTVSVGLDERGEAPLADPFGVGQHRREDRYVEQAHARRHLGLTGSRLFAEESPGWQDQSGREGKEEPGLEL